jgi:predicted RNase H-like nuclease (RuvC/YqgF family)
MRAFFCPPSEKGKTMGGEGNVTQAPDEKQQEKTQEDKQERAQESPQIEDAPDYKQLLDEQTTRIQELEAQVAQAAKTKESAEQLSKEITKLKEDAADQRVDFELRLAGCRSTKAARVLLAEHQGDVAALKEAEPWLFTALEETQGATGLEPAGVASKDEKAEMRRWREIAGLAERREKE